MNDAFFYWERKVSESPDPPIVEAGFLRSYISFEEFIAKSFISFSLGESHGEYTPDRFLQFSSTDQLFETIRGESQYVDVFKAIPRCAKHIFIKNPFEIVFSDANFSDPLTKMRVIRNYLAHRSAESKEKFKSKVLGAYNLPETLDPGDFLLMKRKGNQETYYSHYIEILKKAHAALNDTAILKAI